MGFSFDTEFPASIENQTDLSDVGAAPPNFFNPKSAVSLALNQPVTVSSAAPGSDPANAVDGLAFTSWQSSDPSHL